MAGYGKRGGVKVNALTFRWPFTLVIIGLFLLPMLMSGCVVPGGEYGGYDLGYYEPSGINYGGWGVGYDVGPARGGEVHRYYGGAAQHTYRPAPASHPIPSIPSRVRPSASTHAAHGGPTR
jgi:hypothetical protein